MMNRRHFMRLCGCACCGALLTLAGCGKTATSAATPTAASATVTPTPTPAPTSAESEAAAIAPTAAAEPTALPRTGKVACPKGQYWDPYPGRCRLYRDTNGNGYCDWSEPA